MKIIIRADSGTIMGSGHIMRCLTLASELSSNPLWKASITFACRNLPGNIISVIESRGYLVKSLHDSLEKANNEFVDFLKQENPEILIIDNYDTDIELESKAREYVGSIVVIDDLANRKHDCDVLLDQNLCPSTHAEYNNLLPISAIKLFGLNFALLGKEFFNFRKEINTFHSIKNVLIFFGGGDHKNLTQKVIKALVNNADYRHINFNVVVGNSNPNKDKIHLLCKENKNFKYHCQINNMAELMQNADLFIGAGGTTNWERMFIGLPGIIISIAANQEEICKELAKIDVIKYLGAYEEFAPQDLLDTLEWIQKEPDWILNAARRGQLEIDGYGTKRVAAIILALIITFQEASRADCENIFHWRNSDENRLYSINNNIIEFDIHQKWFTKIIADKNHDLLIAHHNKQPFGVVRFDYNKDNAEISLYLVPGIHGKGYGLTLLNSAELWLRKNRADISEINAKVIIDNIASKKIFAYALYKEIESDKSVILFNKRLK